MCNNPLCHNRPNPDGSPCSLCAQPAPAPLPGDDGEICSCLLFACTGHPHALIPWPHRLLHDAVAHISDLTRRLAEVEEENVRLRPRAEIAGSLLTRTSKAEKRCRELEEALAGQADAHAKLGAAIEWYKERLVSAEAFKTRVMELARGACGTCEHRDRPRTWDACWTCMDHDAKPNWTPPQAWEVGE